MSARLIYEEYECASYCSPNGCTGHDGRVVGIAIDGFEFCDEESYLGDHPHQYKERVAALERAVAVLNGAAKVREAQGT